MVNHIVERELAYNTQRTRFGNQEKVRCGILRLFPKIVEDPKHPSFHHLSHTPSRLAARGHACIAIELRQRSEGVRLAEICREYIRGTQGKGKNTP